MDKTSQVLLRRRLFGSACEYISLVMRYYYNAELHLRSRIPRTGYKGLPSLRIRLFGGISWAMIVKKATNHGSLRMSRNTRWMLSCRFYILRKSSTLHTIVAIFIGLQLLRRSRYHHYGGLGFCVPPLRPLEDCKPPLSSFEETGRDSHSSSQARPCARF